MTTTVTSRGVGTVDLSTLGQHADVMVDMTTGKRHDWSVVIAPRRGTSERIVSSPVDLSTANEYAMELAPKIAAAGLSVRLRLEHANRDSVERVWAAGGVLVREESQTLTGRRIREWSEDGQLLRDETEAFA